jgi:uncharacterized protein YbjT (DUF2867 family)
MVILLFGATGSAGGGVLKACLDDRDVTEVRAIVRRPLAVAHAKLRAISHADYANYDAVRTDFSGVDACFFCLGISTTQVSGEAEYRIITHDYAVAAAKMLAAASPTAGFQFLSGEGAGLDSRFMWARVKAETERDLARLVGANAFRPAYIDGAGSSSEPRLYKLLRPILGNLLRLFPGTYVKATDIGRAMLHVARLGLRGETFRNRRIRELAGLPA